MKDLESRIKLLEKKLSREKKARAILEEEIENKTRDLFISYEYNNLLINSVDNLIVITNDQLEIVDLNKSWGDFNNLKGSKLEDLFKLYKGEEKLRKSIFEKKGKFEDELTLKIGELEADCYVKMTVIKDRVSNDQFIFTLTNLSEMKKIQEEQKKLQDKIIKNAYADGLAESSISVLHNIGNILTPLGIKTSSKKELKNFEKSLDLINTANDKWDDLDEVAKKNVIEVLGRSVEGNINEMKELFKFLSEKCAHIGNIISSQQRYANLKETIRVKTNLVEVVNDCLSMVGDSLKKRNITVELHEDLEMIVLTETVGIAQVVLNLLVNAMESIEQKLKVQEFNNEFIKIQFSENDDQLVMSIVDSGVGVSKENLEKIFAFGFSTKERSSGFGLHNCFNFMSKNEGTITIESEGEYKGATINLNFAKAA